MTKKIVDTFEELQRRMYMTIDSTKGPTAIVGGHYPLSQSGQAAFMPEDEDSFGCFSEFTLDLALNTISYAKYRGKDAKLVVLVDDHSQMPDPHWYMHDEPVAQGIQDIVDKYFSNFKLPAKFQEQIENYHLGLDDILPSNFGPVFQESKYRTAFADQYPGVAVGCAGEYTLILQELAKNGIASYIGLIPERCQSPTCNATSRFHLTKDVPKMKVFHAYFSTGLETPTDMLYESIAQYGGIRIFREH